MRVDRIRHEPRLTRWQRAIVSRYVAGHTQTAVAELYCTTQSAVAGTIARAIRRAPDLERAIAERRRRDFARFP